MSTGIPTDKQVNAMTPTEYKTYENRVRREAQRQNLRLAKNRRRDPRAWDYNTYMLLDPHHDPAVALGERQYGLIAVHEYLQRPGGGAR